MQEDGLGPILMGDWRKEHELIRVGSRSHIRRGFLQLESEVRNLSPELSFDFMEVVVSLMKCDWTA